MKVNRSLIFAAMVSLLIVAGCIQQSDEITNPSEKLTGAWRSTVQFQSGAFAQVKDLEFIYGFHQGGTMTESSNYDGAPPVPPAYGIWREIEQNRFEARYEFYLTRVPDSAEGMPLGSGFLPAGHGVLTETITLSADEKSFNSQIKMQLFDKSGNPIEGGGDATGRGTRLTF